MGLEFGRVGHRERGAIDVEDAMAEPATGVAGGGKERIGDATEQDLEDRERQAGASLAVGGGGEDLAGEMGKVRDRGVSVEDLDQKDVESVEGVEEAGSPLMTDLSTDVGDGRAVEKWGGVLLEIVKGAKNAVMHQGTSWTWFCHKPIVTGGSSFCNLFREDDLSHPG